jgi:tRNA-uridine 2-sulfurtransferase
MNKEVETAVAVGLSGGVDSSVALYLLSKEYDHIVGASHDICTNSLTCNEQTLGRARDLAARFGIPYYRFDLIDEFSESVIADFAGEYRHGRTPNPCIRCNERIRFNRFYQLCHDRLVSEHIISDQARFLFATGHYARIGEYEGYPVIMKGRDLSKDQSYMLYRILPSRLMSIRFPLGEYTKEEIVKIAVREGFPSSSVKESQDICFIPGKYTDKLIEIYGREMVSAEGKIIDEEGSVLGTHRGYMHYTLGQRQGLGLSDGPWYVKRLDADHNTVVVGRKEALLHSRFSLREENWFIPPALRAELSAAGKLKIKIRYNSPEQQGLLVPAEEGNEIVLGTPASITPGQSAVCYHGEYLLGGGIIDTVSER